MKHTKEEAKKALELIHEKIGVSGEDFDFNKSLKDQGYDSLDSVEFLMEVEKLTGIHEISNNTAEKLLDHPNEFVDYIVKETDYKTI